MPWFKRVLFLVVVGSITYALHFYIYQQFPISIQQFISSFFPMMGTFIMCSYFTVGSVVSTKNWRWMGWVSGLWMGVMFFLLILLGSLHVVTLLCHWMQWDIDRNMIALGLVALSLFLSLYGLTQAVKKPQVKHVTLTLPQLDSRLAGLKIVQLTDIHIGPTLGHSFMQHLVEVTQQQQADLIVITGDLVDGEVELLQTQVAPVFTLQAPLGVYFVTGNHEWISGAPQWVSYLQKGGIRVLQNEHVALSHQETYFNLIGVEDWDAQRFDARYQADLTRAVDGMNSEYLSILLAHQPKAAPQADQMKIDLQLSGHTHGGQIFPLHPLVKWDQKYSRGLFQLDHLLLYVSQGTGYWGPPIRLATRAEITVLSLQT